MSKLLTKKEIVTGVVNSLENNNINTVSTKDYVKVNIFTNIHFEIIPNDKEVSLQLHVESTKTEVTHKKFFNLIAELPELLNYQLQVINQDGPRKWENVNAIKELKDKIGYSVELFKINIDNETSLYQLVQELIKWNNKING